MKKQEIFDCFDSIKKHNQSLLKWMPIVALVFLAMGALYFVVGEYNSTPRVLTLMSAAIGGFILVFLWPIIYFSSISTNKKIEKFTEILTHKPSDLVWSYVFESTRNGVKNEFVVLRSRDGAQLDIHKTNYKPYESKEVLFALRDHFNPNITLGYTEEIKQSYLNGKL